MSVSSTTSMMSSMSVSYKGEEVELSVAVDSVFKDLQTNLNNSHCDVRSILQCDEQDAEYKDILDLCFAVHTNIDAMSILFKDLQGVLKQVSKPQDSEEKEIYKNSMERYKRTKEEQKNNNK
jgi:hypothetical protein